MSLRTAPCPACQNTIVFGERRCRSCGMDFDYGPAGPAIPSAAAVEAALQAANTTPPVRPALARAPASPAPASPTRLAPTAVEAMGNIEGLDSGRFAGVGDVDIEDIPGFIDSTLFAAMTPDHVDVVAIPGLEITRFDTADVLVPNAVEIDSDRAHVGDVAALPAIPGIYGSDMFRADVDVAAGASRAGDLLDVSALRERPKPKKTPPRKGDETHVICTNCGSGHSKSRCPSCGTAVKSG